jgi:hypothetical protein
MVPSAPGAWLAAHLLGAGESDSKRDTGHLLDPEEVIRQIRGDAYTEGHFKDSLPSPRTGPSTSPVCCDVRTFERHEARNHPPNRWIQTEC